MPYDISAPALNPNTFPYRRKWTSAETAELGERIQKLRDAMVDMVGMSGVVMFIDAGSIANIATHLALAGADLHEDERRYIWRDAKVSNDEMFEAVQWRIVADEEPPAPAPKRMDAAKAAAMAEQAQADIRAQLPDEVRELLARNLAREFVKDTTDDEDGTL